MKLTSDEIYWLHLQNNTEHDTFEEAFKAGIECALEEVNLPENKTRKILYDKVNKREVNFQYFFDQWGDCYINNNAFAVFMGGEITIRAVQENDVQYEIREVEK